MLQTRKTLAKLDARHLDTLVRIDLRTGSTDIDTHSIGTRFGTDIDTHFIAYEKVGYKDAQRLSQYTSYSRRRETAKISADAPSTIEGQLRDGVVEA
jgi:enoyl-[acyl-carrier-protein] reductase (NADH)